MMPPPAPWPLHHSQMTWQLPFPVTPHAAFVCSQTPDNITWHEGPIRAEMVGFVWLFTCPSVCETATCEMWVIAVFTRPFLQPVTYASYCRMKHCTVPIISFDYDIITACLPTCWKTVVSVWQTTKASKYVYISSVLKKTSIFWV